MKKDSKKNNKKVVFEEVGTGKGSLKNPIKGGLEMDIPRSNRYDPKGEKPIIDPPSIEK